jgi:cytochrome c oxidase subunit II
VRNRPLLQMIVFGVICCAILIPIAFFLIPWFPAEGSRQASNIHTLYYVLLAATIPIFVLVETVVVFSVWRFRLRPGDTRVDGPPIHGNTRLEVVWTVLPAVLILSLCGYAYSVLHSNEASKPGEMTVNVTARQFIFEFSYPNSGGKTVVSPALYLPKDQPVVFKLRSLDVIHSFFVPEFSEKLDAVPGITTTLRVTPTRIGTYPAECTELCGPGHAFMRATVHVVSRSRFESWLASQPANAAPPVGEPSPKSAQPGVPGSPSSSSSSTSSSSSSSSAGSASSSSSSSIPQGPNAGDADGDNHGGPSDGDGNI